MKIYTRAGDDGTTGLFGGARLGKDDLRIEAYGTVDELNAALGLCVAGDRGKIGGMLQVVQNELFAMGSVLARPDDAGTGGAGAGKGPAVQTTWIARLEGEIDAAEAHLPQLRAFVLPGGCELSARLHLARTVARRAERQVVALGRESRVDPDVLAYLNRLSDWLFVHARLANKLGGVGDVEWVK